MSDSTGERRPWLVAAVVLLACTAAQVGWFLVLPPYSAIDEVDHMLRASSVAEGHVAGGWQPSSNRHTRGDLITVRVDIARAIRARCESLPTKTRENCRPTERVGQDQVRIASGAARYNPAYYFLVAPAFLTAHGNEADVGARIIGSAICVILMAWSAFVIATSGGGRWRLLLLMLAIVPTTAFSFSVAAPNGIQMAAGLGTWVGLGALLGADLVQSDRARPLLGTRAALGLTTLSGVLLPLTHTLGLLWLILIVAAFAALVGPRALGRRWHTLGRPGLLSAALVGLAALAALLWTATTRVNNPFAEQPLTGHSVWPDLPFQFVLWPLQALAVFPFRTNQAPLTVYAIGLVLVGIVVALGVGAARTRSRWIMGLVVLVSFLVPTVLTVLTYDHLGMAWQGRYGYPFSVGIFVLLGHVERAPRTQALAVAASLGWGVSNFLSWMRVRSDFIDPDGWARQAGWTPPSTLLLGLLALLSLVAWSVVLSSRLTPRADDVTSPAPAASR